MRQWRPRKQRYGNIRFGVPHLAHRPVVTSQSIFFEASLDPLVTISSTGLITDVNSATERVTGVKRQALVGSGHCPGGHGQHDSRRPQVGVRLFH